ncbi:MAG TPA: hypothetical protein VMA98_04605 [Candidatus Acidoferrales bacterium]|nr:hypothetical protein [Candidatus Acidoferrales bacterium]
MPAGRDFPGTFRVLKALLAPYAPRLHASQDSETFYMLDGEYVAAFKRKVLFGGVQIRRAYVSFHLMPVYTHPELLGTVDDGLKKRMQGKSCFNFVRPERELLVELSALVDRSFDLYERLGWIK